VVRSICGGTHGLDRCAAARHRARRATWLSPMRPHVVMPERAGC
jgi:hypothetical protein